MSLSFSPIFLEAYVCTSLIYTPSWRKCKGEELGEPGKCMCECGDSLAVINDTAKLNVIQGKIKSLSTLSGGEFWTGVR